MAKNLKQAVARHAAASDELSRALRACLAALPVRSDNVVEGRFRVVGRPARAASARRG